MIRLLKFLLTGDWHLHKWSVVERYPIYGDSDKPKGVANEQECEICGERKLFKVMANDL